MSIDPSTIKPGGKVSVTLTDGTQVLNAPVRVGGDERSADCLFMGQLGILTTRDGELAYGVTIDAYTPPKPEWDRPEVAVVEAGGCNWMRRRALWVSPGMFDRTSEQFEDEFDDISVIAVYAKGVRA